MNFRAWILSSALLLGVLTQTAAAIAAGARDRTEAEARRLLDPCPAEPADAAAFCRYQQAAFVRAYTAGRRGNAREQRNVAYMLLRGAEGAVRIDVGLSCAWYLVAAKRGPTSGIDRAMTDEVCGQLNADERSLAEGQAALLQKGQAPDR